MHIKKAINIFEFFKSTLTINLAVSIVSTILVGINSFLMIFLSFGFLISLLIKEVNYKNDYLFYANNGISKIQLWIYCCCINMFFSIIAILIFQLITHLF